MKNAMKNSGKIKDDEIESKDEKNKIKALRWLRWRLRRNDGGKLNSGKEKMKTLGTRIYSPRTNSERKDYSLGYLLYAYPSSN